MVFPLRDTNPARRMPVMTWTLIALTTGVYVLEVLLHPEHLAQIACYLSDLAAKTLYSGTQTSSAYHP